MLQALHGGGRTTVIIDKLIEIEALKVGPLFLVLKLFGHFVTIASQQGSA